MKKGIKILLMLIAVIIVFSSSNAYAAGGLCTSKKYDDLKAKIKEITANWELNFDEDHQPYFVVELQNVDENLILKFNNENYFPVNGTIKLNEYLIGGDVYSFKMYGGYKTDCVEEYLGTKSLQIPKYNRFSEMNECEVYKDWELCDKWYQGDIKGEEDFYEKLNAYKNSLEPKVNIKENPGDTNYLPYVIVVVVTLAIAIGLYYKKNNRGKKVKNGKK